MHPHDRDSQYDLMKSFTPQQIFFTEFAKFISKSFIEKQKFILIASVFAKRITVLLNTYLFTEFSKFIIKLFIKKQRFIIITPILTGRVNVFTGGEYVFKSFLNKLTIA